MATSVEKDARTRVLKTMSAGTVVFLALLGSILLAGFNSGNNLLFLITGLMLASVFVSLIGGRLNLSRLQADRELPPYIFAGHPFRIGVTVRNHKKVFHSYGVTLHGIAEGHRDLFFVSVENEGEQTREIDASISRRGLHRLPPITLASRFPWGLFELRRTFAQGEEVLVYPHIFDLNKAVSGQGHLREEVPQHVKGPGSGLYGVREYRHGEDAAGICWKLSAKLDRLIVRETESEERKRVCIAFDNALKDRSTVTLEAFERAVSAAASLVWRLTRKGCSVKLVTRDKIVGYGEGQHALYRMLTALALVEPVASGGEEGFFHKHLYEGGAGALVSCRNGTPTIRSTLGDFALVLPDNVESVSR